MSGAFADAPATFTDAIHVTDEANRLIGRRIARDLIAWWWSMHAQP